MRAFTTVLVGLFAMPAAANTKVAPAPVVGAQELWRVAPAAGFVDDAIASDGKRLAYAVSDGSTSAKLHVWTGNVADERTLELAPVTLHPIAVALAGDRAFVVGDDDGKQVAALVELSEHGKKPAGTVVYKLGPATHITIVRDRAVVHRAVAQKTGTRHEIEVVAIATGKRVGAGALELDANNANARLELRINHWSDGMSHAIGVKGGEWNKKEDQRSPDVEATYDIAAGKVIATTAITDLFEQRKRFEVLAAAGGVIDFVKPSWDNQQLQLWRDGKPKPLELDQPLQAYDPKSLQYVIDGVGAWLALKIDPVNADAVARQKADAEYFDVFHVDDGKAARRARFLAAGARYRFGSVGDKLWLLERSTGFDRGGKSIAIYELK
jgi:hypothetical protein